jgi:hypothetical protein
MPPNRAAACIGKISAVHLPLKVPQEVLLLVHLILTIIDDV